MRQDVWTLDAYAWALYANGQYQEADCARWRRQSRLVSRALRSSIMQATLRKSSTRRGGCEILSAFCSIESFFGICSRCTKVRWLADTFAHEEDKKVSQVKRVRIHRPGLLREWKFERDGSARTHERRAVDVTKERECTGICPCTGGFAHAAANRHDAHHS